VGWRKTGPSPPWGRGWTAAGAFFSRGGPGLHPPKRKRRAVNNIGFGPQAGEGVASLRPSACSSQLAAEIVRHQAQQVQLLFFR
jgi:hypothetical protein